MKPLSEQLMEHLVTPTDVKTKLKKECQQLIDETLCSTFRATPSYFVHPAIPNKVQRIIPTIDEIVKEYCNYIGWEVDTLTQRRRKNKIVVPRQRIMHFLEARKVNLKIHLHDIADYFGYNHATILNSKRVCNNQIETDKKYAKIYFEMEEHLKNHFLIR
jgi:hypothetical protein